MESLQKLSFPFAPRIRDLGDTKRYIPRGDTAHGAGKFRPLRPL